MSRYGISAVVLPWEVWWVDFDPAVGREQAGLRPAVVVGTTLACSIPNELVFLVPCTSTDRGLPYQPRITLKRPTFAMCDQMRATSRERLRRRASDQLADEDIDAIKFALRQMIDTY